MAKIIKLVNDHEIIGDLVDEAREFITLSNPFTVHYMMSTRSDKPIIGLMRYMPFAESRDVCFNRRDIINAMEARQSMTSYYHSVLGNYRKFVDDNIDQELEQVAADEQATDEQAELSPAELMATLLSNFTNDKMH
jgi:hypothetical protein